MSLSIDIQPLFDNIQVWLPILIGIFAIPYGIKIGISIIRMVFEMFSNAFA